MTTDMQLYQQVILDHNKKPRNFGKLEPCSHQAEGFNPLCGDHIWVYLEVEAGNIKAIRFEGEECISFQCAIQPGKRPMAKSTVNIFEHTFTNKTKTKHSQYTLNLDKPRVPARCARTNRYRRARSKSDADAGFRRSNGTKRVLAPAPAPLGAAPDACM